MLKHSYTYIKYTKVDAQRNRIEHTVWKQVVFNVLKKYLHEKLSKMMI